MGKFLITHVAHLCQWDNASCSDRPWIHIYVHNVLCDLGLLIYEMGVILAQKGKLSICNITWQTALPRAIFPRTGVCAGVLSLGGEQGAGSSHFPLVLAGPGEVRGSHSLCLVNN